MLPPALTPALMAWCLPPPRVGLTPFILRALPAQGVQATGAPPIPSAPPPAHLPLALSQLSVLAQAVLGPKGQVLIAAQGFYLGAAVARFL